MTASLMTMTLSAIDIASCCEWVTMTKVIPVSRWIFLSSTIICWRRLKSSDPSGSSSRSTVGWPMRARASATRCCCPPLRSLGRRVASTARSTISSICQTRRARSSGFIPFILRLNSTFWNTVR